jgi:hypothetical protein
MSISLKTCNTGCRKKERKKERKNPNEAMTPTTDA